VADLPPQARPEAARGRLQTRSWLPGPSMRPIVNAVPHARL